MADPLAATTPVAAPPVTDYAGLPSAMGVAWWRRLLGALLATTLALAFAGIVLAAGLGAAVVAGVGISLTEPGSTTLFDDPLWEIGVLFAVIAALIPAILIAVRAVEGRPPGTVSSVAGRLRPRLLGLGAALAVPAVVLVLVLLLAFTAGQEVTGEVAVQPAQRVLAGLLVVALVVPFQAAAEEYLRGYVIQVVGRTWPGIAVSGLVWSALHVPSTVWGWLDLAVFSVVAGVLIARLGGLEAAIGLHVVYNLVFLALAVPFLDESTPLASAGDADWALFAGTVVALPMYAWVVLRVTRRGQDRGDVNDPDPRVDRSVS